MNPEGGSSEAGSTPTRTVFATPRAAEFLEVRALQSQTGRHASQFGDVVAKELVDNALDAAEAAAVVPQVEVHSRVDSGLRLVTVTDNGPGIRPEVVEQILDFNVLVSDKAAYRGMTRGSQGNAFKTLLGIPCALGITAPVVIEAHGVRHEIAVGKDPGGNVVVRHDRAASDRRQGTAVTIPLPVDVKPGRWMYRFAAVNPHVTLIELGYGADPQQAVFYKPTAPDGWTKPLPTDKTSPWHYDEAAMTTLVFAHVNVVRNGGPDLPVGEFVRSFQGLASTGKARSVCATVPDIRYVSDFAEHPQSIAVLLTAMKAEARKPKPDTLGRIPADHYRACLEDWYGICGNRFWHRRKEIDLDGVPWAVEVAVAETLGLGEVIWAVNYSATFDDPLGAVELVTADVYTTGAASFLSESDAAPQDGNNGSRAAIVHVITPAPDFLDKGKVRLEVPEAVADVIAEAIGSATKTLRADAKRRERDARAQANREAQRHGPAHRVTLRDAVFDVIAQAANSARGGAPGAPDTLPFSVRSMYYKLRPLLQEITDQELKYAYFTQTLVPEYQREYGVIPDLYYEARGELHEPHTGEKVLLGTREVQGYRPTPWTYNKVLYVEKTGLWPVLQAARLAERYDMAIITGQGYAVEATRTLLADISHDATVFVLHDADPAGYNIARTLGEETARMPEHRIEVIDLGLTVGDAIRHRLPTEAFTRKREIPGRLDRLDEDEQDWFTGHPSGYDRRGTPNQWTCTRVELNAFSSPDLISYIEDGLAIHDATQKVVPPESVLTKEARAIHRHRSDEQVRAMLDEVMGLPTIIDTITKERARRMNFEIDAATVRATLDRHRDLPWSEAVGDVMEARLTATGFDLRARLVELAAAALGGAADSR